MRLNPQEIADLVKKSLMENFVLFVQSCETSSKITDLTETYRTLSNIYERIFQVDTWRRLNVLSTLKRRCVSNGFAKIVNSF